MHPRSHDGHMDFEWQDKPLDPTSPFTHAAHGGALPNAFDSPVRQATGTFRTNPFTTPSKSQQSSHVHLFNHQFSTKPVGSPFRNPSFITPRRPYDEVALSEASGAEDSPALAEASPFPNDTPEADRMSDANMCGTITPSKINKHTRYGKTGPLARKNMSGRGEIRAHRDIDPARRRKRHGHDIRRRDWGDSEDDSDVSLAYSRSRSPVKRSKKAAPPPGMVGSLFHMLDEHANTPDNLHRWFQLGVNGFLLSMFCYVIWAVFETVRSDVYNANEAARQKIQSEVDMCQNHYLVNNCEETSAPKLKELCHVWRECMWQDPNAIMSFRVVAKQVAEVLNEFFGNMNYKASVSLFVGLVLVVVANNAALGRSSTGRGQHVAAAQASGSGQHAGQHPGQHQGMPHDGTADFMWVQVQTPRHQRHGLKGNEEEETDTDSSPPKMMQLPPYTPSRRSPSKRERSRSPIKYGRSPSKGYERFQ